MALRFALLKDIIRGTPSVRSRKEFDVFFLDFDREDDMITHIARPEFARYALRVLVPVRDICVTVRDRLEGEAPRPRDIPWLRSQLAKYLRALVSSRLMSLVPSRLRSLIFPFFRKA